MPKSKTPPFTFEDSNESILTPEIMAAVEKDVAKIDVSLFKDTAPRTREQRREAIRSNMRRIIEKSPE